MKMRTLGTSNIEASAVALGAWAIGGGPWWGESDNELSIRAIHAALDLGVNLIDTAPVYGFGNSEEVVGRAIKDRRDKVILATKCGLWWHDSTGNIFFEMAGKTIRRTLGPATIRQEIELSLKRLGTDYIDLYQTHWPSLDPDNETIAETMDCLMTLKQQGKIRAVGASNVNVEQIQAYQAAGVLDAIQPRYSMLDRKAEASVFPFCVKQTISTLVYSPLEQGLLTGNIGMDYVVEPETARFRIPWFKPENRQRVLKMLEGWNDLTEQYSCRLSQLVIAWTIEQRGVTYALCGSRKPEHSIENAGAGHIDLAAEDLQRMRDDVEALGKPL
ncbi:aldo/keto reductase [candidate division KSB3 bacterium]|uniref:Aldo/keto reductase n=1 Tax=candidate division KSB3 bacterium TaxID=2044937 RepID=A0A2G6E210_9BACT|nr:MAG: aldo/keto reductase [candidate division KSB3 bacterium]PIE30336.1 MAG: aldo/keto reductase [candidate division KSB3 bacterium]